MEQTPSWPAELHAVLKANGVRHVGYVPDAGHARLIELCRADPEIESTVLTTEEEGIALAAGCWLGGMRSVLLMQSSGVGNCINMLSLVSSCRFPQLMLVTMRGEWGEFNPWQIPMGRGVEDALGAVGVRCIRVDDLTEAPATTAAAARLVFDADQSLAILLSQRGLGAKVW